MNATTKHTPGPWYCLVRPQPDLYEVFADGRDIPMDERCANARLIEAAPDMLAALRMICDAGIPLAEPIERAMLDALRKTEG